VRRGEGTGQRRTRPPNSPLHGGRRRDDPSGRRFVLALIVILALCALGLWLIDNAPGAVGRGNAGRTARAAIRAEFGAGALGACMLSIAERESRLDPRATNWSDRHSDGSRGSFGLFQIGAVHRAAGESVAAFRLRMLEPAANSRMAHRLERGAGLAPWGGFC